MTSMLAEPLITTVIPTYRRPDLLRRAIRSVLDQTYPHFKICVYDNASNDRTEHVVKELTSYDTRVHYHRNLQNVGAQENFILGLSQVDTSFVHLISDDDFLLPDFFLQATAALQHNPKAAFFSGGMFIADQDGRVSGFPRYGSETEQVHFPPKLFDVLVPCTRTWTSALFRRESLESVGGLRKATGYSFSIDLILRLATRYEAILSDRPCAVLTVHPGSSSVAEAAEAFGSLLNLEFFRSINNAIDGSQGDNIVDEHDAEIMKAALRTVTEQTLFHGAFGFIARGQLAIALRASHILATHFKRRDMAIMINAAALDNGIGSLLRMAVRHIKVIRKLWLAPNTGTRHPVYSEIVQRRLHQLSA
jgi:glycosyltransferase involved in cell wall biosynthesis